MASNELFARSNKLLRTPPRTFSCKKCSNADSNPMVVCNTCNVAFHNNCAGITSETNVQEWTCEDCLRNVQVHPNNSTPVVVPANENVNNTSICQSCLHQDDESRVQCDVCDLWFHFKCVNVTSAIKNEDWMCANCQCKADLARVNANVSKVPNSRKSKSGTSMSSRRKSLALQKLEEEQRLRAQREQEYLDKKYSILDLETSEGSIDDTMSDTSRRTRTNEWIELLNNAPVVDDKVVSQPVPSIETNPQTIPIESQIVVTSQEPITTEAVLDSWSKMSSKDGYVNSINRTFAHNLTNDQIQSSPLTLPTTSEGRVPTRQIYANNSFESSATVSATTTTQACIKRAEPKLSKNNDGDNLFKPKLNSSAIPVLGQMFNTKINEMPMTHHIYGNRRSHANMHPCQNRVPDPVLGQTSSTTTQSLTSTSNRPKSDPIMSLWSKLDKQSVELNSQMPVPTKSTNVSTSQTLISNYQPIMSAHPTRSAFYQPRGSIHQPASSNYQPSGSSDQTNGSNQQFVRNHQPAALNHQPMASNYQLSMLNNQPMMPNYQPSVLNNRAMRPNYQSSVLNAQPMRHNYQPSVLNTQPMMPNYHSSVSNDQPMASNYQVDGLNQYQPMSSSHPSMGSTFTSNYQTVYSQPAVTTSSHQQYPPPNNQNLVSISQPFNMYPSINHNYGGNQSYSDGNAMAQTAAANTSIQPRLTAEQIAARHVMPRDLPHFYGDPDEWEAFISAYENSTDTCGFSNSENLGRLQRCLKGDARAAVRSRLLHRDSVPGVIHTLRLMYGRPELIIETMIRDIQKIPPPKDDDLASLIKYAIAVQNLSGTIQNTGAHEHLRNPMLINSITDKLPSQLQLMWAFHKSGIGNVTLADLGDWLYRIADVASQVVRVPSKSSSRKREQKNDNNSNNHESNVSKSNKDDNNSNNHKSNVSKSNNYLNAQVENISKKNDSKAGSSKNCPACHSSSCAKLFNCKKFKEATRTEKWTIVRDNKLCCRCFGIHKFYRCKSTQNCKVDGCKSNNHTLLHNYDGSPDAKTKIDPKSVVKSGNTGDKDTGGADKRTCNSQRSKINQRMDVFRIVPVMVHHKNKSIREYAYLDEGSNMTTMEESLADELELNGTPEKLCVDWAFGQTHSTVESRIVTIGLSGFYENAPRFKLDNVRTVKTLHLPTQSITESWLEQFPHLRNIPITTYESAKPRILLGLQYSRLTVSLETIEGGDKEPIACKTRLGWVVQGPSYNAKNEANTRKYSMNMCVCQSHDNELHQLVKDYFAMENIGVKVSDKMLESKEVQRANEILESTTIKRNGRYETGLLWKYDNVELPDSYHMALKRLECLEAKMAKNPQLKANLFKQIEEFVEKRYARKLSPEEVKNCNHRVWYLPTFPVFNPKKPEKVRIVWDGAAKVKNTSLNSNLLTGPDQYVPLPDILRRFRERPVALTGDIKEMYHQVRVKESDQHVQRFLWRHNPSKEPDIYVMEVMTFGSKCSPSSAQFVKNKNAMEFKDDFPRAVEAIIDNHYVDDMIDCTSSVDEAAKLVQEVKAIHQCAGFEIRNFASNSKELLEKIGEKTNQQNKNLNINTQLGTERVLGMFWDTASDCFTYSLKFTTVNERMLSGEYCPTKREVLRTLMSIFDPLGLLANFLVYGKILLQEIWRSNIGWDEQLTAPIYAKWAQWIKALPNVENIRIPRLLSPKLSPKTPKLIQLHTFVDASIEAYAASTYLRVEDDDGVDCCLVGAKTKVAPNKPMSVPRLELQAAVLGTRLAKGINASQTLKFEKQVFWSDSQTVMGWINSEARRYNQFVSFRIGEILETTEQNEWRWVPSKQNVADEATKSKEVPLVDSSSRWYKAPKFLYDDESTWFKDETVEMFTEEELKPCFVMACTEIVCEQLVDVRRFSQWNRLFRAQAYALRFIRNVKHGKQNRQVGPLSQEELIKAENHLYRRAQRDCFLDEILILKHNEKNQLANHKKFDKTSQLLTYSPYLDEHGVLRLRGRIDAAECVSIQTKRPVILPRRHYITKLIVDYYHRRYKHLNHQTALNEIRQKYEIPALRVVMKGIRSSCQKCKNATAMPKIPEMAELPPARLAAYTRPFTYVGLDYFGPIKVKVGRSVVPRYGVIFTCLTIRAIHLEIVDSLDTSECIRIIRKFGIRKGEPREYFSDNGTNFHGTENALKAEFQKLDQDLIQQEFTTTEQKWNFNPPTASHMGGAWERLIRTVKSCLKQIMTTKTPTHAMLDSLVVEVEGIINSRPLTYVSLDSADDEALTPNHFLFGSSNRLKPIARTTSKNLLRNDWRAIQEMTNHFWRRFVLEYMPTLTKRTKWLQQVEPIKVGDVVLNIDEKNPRNTWPKGIVEEVIIGTGCHIRQAIIRMGKRTYKRPVSKLAILDVKPPTKDNEVKLDLMESVNGGKDVGQHCSP